MPGAPTSTAPRRGGRRSQRDEILRAAVEVFARGGTRGTPLVAIAERIGVTVPAITHHFGTKDALILEVVAATDTIDELRITDAADALRSSSSGAMTGLEQLSAVRNWARVLSADPELANLTRLSMVMRTEAIDEDFPARAHFLERDRALRDRTAAMIDAGRRDGSIRVDVDPLLCAIEMLAFVQGAVRQWLLDRDSINLVALFEQYFDRLARSCAAV